MGSVQDFRQGIGQHSKSNSSMGMAPESAESVLKEIFHLLEEYGPAWYTEELHDRAALALRDPENQ